MASSSSFGGGRPPRPAGFTITRKKTGCLTCRIRRKKCDEQADQFDRCQECVRLKIPCLGWDEKRPEWCRDKEKLREFKENIKKQLMTRAPSRAIAAPVGAAVNHPDSSGSASPDGSDDAFYEEIINEPVQPSHQLMYPGYAQPSSSNTTRSPDMFDYPLLGSQLQTISTAAQVPAEYLLIVNQIAELANWKALQDANETLSYRELARRGQMLERSIASLHQNDTIQYQGMGSTGYGAFGMASPNFGTTFPGYGFSNTNIPSRAASPAFKMAGFSGSSQSSQLMNPMYSTMSPQMFQQEMYPTTTQLTPLQSVFKEACILALHSTLSGPNPRVPELFGGSQRIVSHLSGISFENRSSSLLFPLCIAAILADQTELPLIQQEINALGADRRIMDAVIGLVDDVRRRRWAHEMNAGRMLHQ